MGDFGAIVFIQRLERQQHDYKELEQAVKLDRCSGRWCLAGNSKGPMLAELLALCEHPYWSRAWIVQEVTLAREVQMECSNTELDIKHPADRLQHMRNWVKSRKFYDIPDIVTKILQSPAAKLIAKRQKWQESHGCSYINLWDSGFGNLGCSDVRGRVYAMAAVMDPKLTVILDYNKTPPNVFKDIFEQHPRRTGAFAGTI